CDCKVRMGDDADEGDHPRVHVTSKSGDAFGCERERVDAAGCRLTDVERLIAVRGGVHIVKTGIAVSHLERLANLQTEDPRHVHASGLIDDDRLARRRWSVWK